MTAIPLRYDTEEDLKAGRPLHVVWEITLACNLHCKHCGSRAGAARPGELTTEECIDIIHQLAKMGTREISLIGGEAFIRRDWLELIRKITDLGMACAMQSGGYFLTEERIVSAKEAGLQGFGISIDGMEALHDELRGVKGSYKHAVNAIKWGKKHGMAVSVNTQIGAGTIGDLQGVFDMLVENEIENWQVQLTVAMGNASDNEELLLQPYQLSKVMDVLAGLFLKGVEHGLVIQAGNNIGYFGPYETYWVRGTTMKHYSGCAAGQTSLGIEADGTIKGCPSLPTSDYTGGNSKKRTLADIWENAPELRFVRDRTVNDLWGYCRTCYYADVCRAGCTWTGHVLFGRAGNNPYCHHRSIELEKQGLRERIEKVADASGKPFDFATFDIILETTKGEFVRRINPASWEQENTITETASAHQQNNRRTGDNRVPEELITCPACDRHVYPTTKNCPFCEADIESAIMEYQSALKEAQHIAGQMDDMN